MSYFLHCTFKLVNKIYILNIFVNITLLGQVIINSRRKVVLALCVASSQYNLPWDIMTNLGHTCITGPL